MAAPKNYGEEINAIADAMELYGDSVPRVGMNGATPMDVYNSLAQNSKYLNEFVDAYLRIAFTVISSRVWENPLDFLVKKQNYGYAIEELFVNLAKPLAYDPWGKGEEQWKRVMPDVRNMMHVVNVKFFGKQTVYDEGLRTAFTNESEWSRFRADLVAAVTDTLNVSIYSGIVYMIALYLVETGSVNMPIADYTTNPKDAVEKLKVLSDKMTFKTRNYNPAGVYNYTPKDRQYIFVTPEFDAKMDVEVYAYMFGPSYGELPQQKVLINSFAEHDYSILNAIYEGGVPKVFTDAEVEYLKNVPALLVDRDFLFIYNLFDRWGAPWNDQKLYWNYMHHWQGTMSYSPFANGVALYTGAAAQPTAIQNPFGKTAITIGRDNMLNVMPAIVKGLGAENALVDGVVAGDGLSADAGNPGWYQASNTAGDKATITYTYTPDKGDAITLTVNVTVV